MLAIGELTGEGETIDFGFVQKLRLGVFGDYG
jgi:hypothetical protein